MICNLCCTKTDTYPVNLVHIEMTKVVMKCALNLSELQMMCFIYGQIDTFIFTVIYFSKQHTRMEAMESYSFQRRTIAAISAISQHDISSNELITLLIQV